MKGTPSAGDLPLEDPRWIPLITEHRRLAERLSSGYLAALDLTRAIVDVPLRCMGRLGERRELVPRSFWAEHELVCSTATTGLGLDLGLRRRMLKSGPYARVRAGALFVWKPDIDKFWLQFELPPVPDQRLEAIDPPALAASPEPSPAPINKPAGPLKQRIRAAFLKSRPLADDGYTTWAEHALPNDNPHSVSTLLSENKSLCGKKWAETPVRRGRKPRV